MKNLRQMSGKDFFESLKNPLIRFFFLGILLFFVFFFGLSFLLVLKLLIYIPIKMIPYIFLLYGLFALSFAVIYNPTFKIQNSKKDKFQTIIFVILGLLNYAVCGFYGQINRLASDFAGETWFQILTYSYSS